MSGIQATCGTTPQLETIATLQQINTALMRKSLDVQKQTGESINTMLQQAVEIQRQLASGHLDIRV